MPKYNPDLVERIYNNICFRQDGCLEGLQIREFAKRLWNTWEAQAEQDAISRETLNEGEHHE